MHADKDKQFHYYFSETMNEKKIMRISENFVIALINRARTHILCHAWKQKHRNKYTESLLFLSTERESEAVRTMLVESLPWISVIFSIYFAYISDKMNTTVRLIHANECVKLWKSRIYRVAFYVRWLIASVEMWRFEWSNVQPVSLCFHIYKY